MIRTYLTYSRDLGDFRHNLVDLHQQGLSGVRLIYKGKTTEEFIQRIEEVHTALNGQIPAIDILVDLPGEKPLIGNVGAGLKIEKGEEYLLCDNKKEHLTNEIPTINFLQRIDRRIISNGDLVSIADGELEMTVVSVSPEMIRCRALNSFTLTSNRSFSMKGNKIPVQPVSREDREFLHMLTTHEILNRVKIVVSFVTKASQLEEIRRISLSFYLIAKVESIINDEELEEIIRSSDAIMLGRGDLTNSSRISEVFSFQKKVIEKCTLFKKELIVATGLFGELSNSGKPSISDIMDFSYLKSNKVRSFLIAGSTAHKRPFESLNLMMNFEKL